MNLLAQLVPKEAVQAQLTSRSPELLDDPESEFFGLYDLLLEGIAEEVAAVCGDPPAEFLRGLAVQCVVIGTAADIESSLFPEQLNGDTSRAQQLRDKYVALLASLRQLGPIRQGSRRAGSVRLHNTFIYDGLEPPAPLQPPVPMPPGTYLQWNQVP